MEEVKGKQEGKQRRRGNGNIIYEILSGERCLGSKLPTL